MPCAISHICMKFQQYGNKRCIEISLKFVLIEFSTIWEQKVHRNFVEIRSHYFCIVLLNCMCSHGKHVVLLTRYEFYDLHGKRVLVDMMNL